MKCLNNAYVTRGTAVEWLEDDLDDTLLHRLLRNIHGIFAVRHHFSAVPMALTTRRSSMAPSQVQHQLADLVVSYPVRSNERGGL